jgi:single-stranded-DNA-specific exonuclease
MSSIQTRAFDAALAARLAGSGLSPELARIHAARGATKAEDIAHKLDGLAPPAALKGAADAARLLADAIEQRKRLLIVADYDADGATACAIGVAGLRAMGASVDYLVPDRMVHGYGLTPAIVDEAAARAPDLIVTVDNGIAANEGVAHAARLGIPVLVTDHHLPGEALPEAVCIVNPNQPGCEFPSKHLAGVGVMFYVLLALRAELRARGAWHGSAEPDLRTLLDRVALGTVADVVRLDANNRRLVAAGLARIRAGRASPGMTALFAAAGRDPARAASADLGFSLGPRLNAAGRLDDMSIGIECLLAENADAARELAARLDALNRERRAIESGMQETALEQLDDIEADDRASLALFDARWHAGVVGILASRLKERFHRPAFAFARADDGTLRGSGRSIAALHLRDALDRVDRRHPGLMTRFGGHAMAAGLTLPEANFDRFVQAFEHVAREQLSPADLMQTIETDGELAPGALTRQLALDIENEVWGQGYPAPSFHGEFAVRGQRIVGERHLRLTLERHGAPIEAMLFFHDTPLPQRIRAVYAPMLDRWNGRESLRIKLSYWEAA